MFLNELRKALDQAFGVVVILDGRLLVEEVFKFAVRRGARLHKYFLLIVFLQRL